MHRTQNLYPPQGTRRYATGRRTQEMGRVDSAAGTRHHSEHRGDGEKEPIRVGEGWKDA